MERGIITISKDGTVTIPTAQVWMTKFEIADLFGVFAYDIRKAIRQIYRNGELQEDETMKYIHQGENINCVMSIHLKWLSPSRSGHGVKRQPLSENSYRTGCMQSNVITAIYSCRFHTEILPGRANTADLTDTGFHSVNHSLPFPSAKIT